MLELQDIGSRQPSMESLTGAPDGSHLHPGHQYSGRRSPSLRFVQSSECNETEWKTKMGFCERAVFVLNYVISIHYFIVKIQFQFEFQFIF